MLHRKKMLNEMGRSRRLIRKEILLVIQFALAILRAACGGTQVSPSVDRIILGPLGLIGRAPIFLW
jgi:hypothetical protein